MEVYQRRYGKHYSIIINSIQLDNGEKKTLYVKPDELANQGKNLCRKCHKLEKLHFCNDNCYDLSSVNTILLKRHGRINPDAVAKRHHNKPRRKFLEGYKTRKKLEKW